MRWLGLALIMSVLGTSVPARSADILLDEPVRLRDVICFPSRADANKFYYAPVRARLAQGETGLPQFSFLRWVENVSSDPGQADATEGIGGGIVHAAVALGLTDEEVAEARRELERMKPGARLEGPVIFDSGRFALITSFKPENGDLVRQLVGTGDAPVIEGSKAAISLTLTKRGAQILWESFKTATPDVSFLFTLELQGFRAPVQATLEADFNQIYKHESFAEKLELDALAEAGAAIPVDEIVQGVALASGTPIPPGALPNLDVGIKARAGGYLKSEIDRVFDDLRERGAIKVNFVGDTSRVQSLIDSVYERLLNIVFEPAKSSTAAAPGLQSRTVFRVNVDRDEAVVVSPPAPQGAKTSGAELPWLASAGTLPSKSGAATDKPPAADSKPQAAEDAPPPGSSTGGAPVKKPGEAAPKPPKTAGRKIQRKLESSEAKAQPDPVPHAKPTAADRFAESLYSKKQPALKTPAPIKPKSGRCSGYETGGPTSGLAQLSFALDACLTMKYQFKQKRVDKKYTFDLRQYSPSTLRVAFAENVGDLRRHLADPAVFRSVNLDDPFYKQREIATSLNGVVASDFGKLLNSVAVQLRKRHESGEESFAEVRIDQAAFARRGSDYKLLYGWKGDDDRTRWQQYEYRSLWSFVGGHQLESDWQPGAFNVINLDPPFVRRSLFLEGSLEQLRERRVRLVSVRVVQDLAGRQSLELFTLRPEQGDVARQVEILSPAGVLEIAYEIDWRLADGTKLSSGRVSTTDDVLFVDFLPGE
jgi:hypothetical protein